MNRIGLSIWLMICVVQMGGGQSPPKNFYLSESTSPTKAQQPDRTDNSKLAKPEEQKKKQPKAEIATEIRSPGTTDFDPPLDPYGIAMIFHERWDFSTFLMSAKEELRYRLNAGRSKTLRLARAFSALSTEVESRQRNLNSAALAAYLLSRDQHSWMPIEGRSLTEAQMLAVRATMRQDISAMQSALTDYDTLRNALNSSAEELATMEKHGLPEQEKSVSTEQLTIPLPELVRSQTQSALEEKVLPLDVLKVALAVETLRDTTERRQSIASFAPPPPTGRALPGRATAKAPDLPSDEVMKNQPKGATLTARPRRTFIVIETPVNAPIYGVRDGVVAFAGSFRGYGNMVILEHKKGEFSVYSHLANVQVVERQAIKSGEILGRAGPLPEIGLNGMHFQVRKGTEVVSAEEWLGTNQIQGMITRK